MFDPDTSLLLRGLSLFHVFLPVLLLWMLLQVGCDARAFVAQTVFGEVLLVLTYAFTDPSKNINWVFGPGSQPQRRVPSAIYLAAVMVFFPMCVYWPTHNGFGESCRPHAETIVPLPMAAVRAPVGRDATIRRRRRVS
jgi:hypothetical protein